MDKFKMGWYWFYFKCLVGPQDRKRSIFISIPKRSAKECSMCVLNHFSHVQLFATLWTVAHHDHLSRPVILQARILEWVAMISIFPTQKSNQHILWLLICRRILYHWVTREAHSFIKHLIIGQSFGSRYSVVNEQIKTSTFLELYSSWEVRK